MTIRKSISEEDAMKIIADKIGEELDREMKEAESAAERNLSPDPKILELARRIDAQRIQERKRWRYRCGVRIAAVFLVCLIGAGVILAESSEAFRVKFFNIFRNYDNTVILLPETEAEMLDGWKDYWYPSYMPEEFKLTAADESYKYLVFQSEQDEREIIISEEDGDATVSYEKSEEEEITETKVMLGDKDGYLIASESGNYAILLWKAGDMLIELRLKGSTDSKLAIKIAENMKYIS